MYAPPYQRDIDADTRPCFLQKFYEKLKDSEEGQTYVKKYRKRKNDEQALNEVKATLPHLFS